MGAFSLRAAAVDCDLATLEKAFSENQKTNYLQSDRDVGTNQPSRPDRRFVGKATAVAMSFSLSTLTAGGAGRAP